MQSVPGQSPSIRRDAPFLASAVLFLAAVLYFAGASPFARADFPLDDAWIHQVYARSLAAGHGLAFNDGRQEAGTTSPLWAIATAPVHLVAGDRPEIVATGVKAVGILLGLASLYLLFRVGSSVTGSASAGAAAAALFAWEPRFVFSALSGMETMLLVCILLAVLHCAIRARWFAATLIAGLAPLARPEALVFVPVCFVASLLFGPAQARRHAVRAWPFAVLPLAAWAVFCVLATGHPLPNTYYVKAHAFRFGGEQARVLGRMLFDGGYGATPLLLLGISAFVVFRRPKPTGSFGTTALFLLVGPLLYAIAVAGSRDLSPFGYYWTRWVDPAVLLITCAGCLGLAKSAAAMPAPLAWRPAPAAAALAAALGLVAWGAPGFARSVGESRFHLWSDARAVRLLNVEAGRWVDATLPRGAVIGVNDAGAIRYFGRRKTIDLVGLNDADVAFRRVSIAAAVDRCDWLVVSPAWSDRFAVPAPFRPRMSFSIPAAEYTVCDCPGQASIAALERTGGSE